MAADHKSCLGLVDAAGKLVGNLSASDLRGLTTPEAFATLLKCVRLLVCGRGGLPGDTGCLNHSPVLAAGLGCSLTTP